MADPALGICCCHPHPSPLSHIPWPLPSLHPGAALLGELAAARRGAAHPSSIRGFLWGPLAGTPCCCPTLPRRPAEVCTALSRKRNLPQKHRTLLCLHSPLFLAQRCSHQRRSCARVEQSNAHPPALKDTRRAFRAARAIPQHTLRLCATDTATLWVQLQLGGGTASPRAPGLCCWKCGWRGGMSP